MTIIDVLIFFSLSLLVAILIVGGIRNIRNLFTYRRK